MIAKRKVKLPHSFPMRDVRKIFTILQDKKADQPHILMVGGVVRDILLKRNIGDIDFATTHIPREVMKRFKTHSIKVIPTGIDHGTVTVVMGNNHYQITTLRRDVDTDGRHAKIAFSNNWVEDARRRDFTINTLLMDVDGHVYDPLGVGLKDIAVAKVKFVGDARTRIREDYLRILRFYRFYARFGRGKIDSKTHKALKEQRAGLKTLSRERITEEIFKILETDKAAALCQRMKKDGILPALFARDLEKNKDDFFKALAKTKSIDPSLITLMKHAMLLRLTSPYFSVSRDKLREWQHTLKATRMCKNLTPTELRRLYYLYDQRVAIAAVCIATQRNGWVHKDMVRAVRYLIKNPRPVFAWRGQDLLDLGYTPGPQIKNALKKLERVWIKEGLK